MNLNSQLKARNCVQKPDFSPCHFVFICAEFVWHYITQFLEVLLHSSEMDFLSLHSFISTKKFLPFIIESPSQITDEYVE